MYFKKNMTSNITVLKRCTWWLWGQMQHTKSLEKPQMYDNLTAENFSCRDGFQKKTQNKWACFVSHREISVDERQFKSAGWYSAENASNCGEHEVPRDLMLKFINYVSDIRIPFYFTWALVLLSSCQTGLALMDGLRQPLSLVFHTTTICQDFNLHCLVHASSIVGDFNGTPWSGFNTSSSACQLLASFNLMPQTICH